MASRAKTAPDRGAPLVLGFDPGTQVTGWGVVRAGRPPVLEGSGAIRPGGEGPLEARLEQIYDRARALIKEYGPDVVAVEDPFVGRSASSALVLGHARGVLLLAAARSGVPIAHYTPGAVKSSVVGRGSADKEQVQFMVQRLLHLAEAVRPLDASDAVAVALCHLHRGGGGGGAFASGGRRHSPRGAAPEGEEPEEAARRLASRPEDAEAVARWKAGRKRRR